MLDSILGRKNFKTKCKSALTRTKTRLDGIKRKRNAMQKFLKKDIADLLKNNLDRNAYGRAEGLYIELNLSSCYDYVEECCKQLLANLKTMREQRECPEECKAAVASLVYAAARFADLPELRDLRSLFHDKYGDTLEPYVSKEFVDKLRSRPPTMEMKLQLMQEVAKELSVAWDSRNFEEQLRNPSMPTHDHGGNDPHNMLRTKSTLVQRKDRGKQSDEPLPLETKMRHTQSLSVVRVGDNIHNTTCRPNHESLQNRKHDSNLHSEVDNSSNRKLFTSGLVPAPYTILPDKTSPVSRSSLSTFENPEYSPRTTLEEITEVGSARKVPRPKSVRTKFLKPSLSCSPSSSDYDTDLKDTFSSRSSREMSFDLPEEEELGEDEDEKVQDVWTYFGKISPKILSPSSAKSVQSPIAAAAAAAVGEQKEAAGSPSYARPVPELLPLPPGRRRYFSESQPSTPHTPQRDDDGGMKYEALLSPGKSRFLPPELQPPPKSPVERKVSRHSRSGSQSDDLFSHVHPRMPDFDELAERIAVLKQVQ